MYLSDFLTVYVNVPGPPPPHPSEKMLPHPEHMKNFVSADNSSCRNQAEGSTGLPLLVPPPTPAPHIEQTAAGGAGAVLYIDLYRLISTRGNGNPQQKQYLL
jgi:hypothetical protein